MALLSKEKQAIKNDYFRVWDIVELLYKKTDDDWFEVVQFLGHHNFFSDLVLFEQDSYYRTHEIHDNYEPIRKVTELLNLIAPWDSEEETKGYISKAKAAAFSYLWLKQDIYNFKPIMNLGIIQKPIATDSHTQKNSSHTQSPPPPATIISSPRIEQESLDKYKFFLYKQPVFNVKEAACIITNNDPLEIDRLPFNDLDQIVPDYSRAYSLLYAACSAGMLEITGSCIYKADLQKYLLSENIIINGFNDSESYNTVNNIYESQNEDLLKKIQKLEKENQELKIQIQELEILQDDKVNLLDLIFDESATERYAPDLALSIRLWEDLYIKNPKDDSHSNHANFWIKSNTGYDVAKKQGSASKIREITTPFKKWSGQRNKNYKK